MDKELIIYLRKLAQIESSGNAFVRAKTSSATGLFQMTQGTFSSLQTKYPWLKSTTWERHAIDPSLQFSAICALVAENDAIMRKRKHAITDLNRYLYHFAGAGAGGRLVDAAGHMPVAPIMGKLAMAANPMLNGMIVGKLKQVFEGKLNAVSVHWTEPEKPIKNEVVAGYRFLGSDPANPEHWAWDKA